MSQKRFIHQEIDKLDLSEVGKKILSMVYHVARKKKKKWVKIPNKTFAENFGVSEPMIKKTMKEIKSKKYIIIKTIKKKRYIKIEKQLRKAIKNNKKLTPHYKFINNISTNILNQANKKLLSLLYFYQERYYGVCWLSNDQLTERLNREKTTIKRGLKKLKELNIIDIKYNETIKLKQKTKKFKRVIYCPKLIKKQQK